jgi:uncharacterized membrane protein YhaH (DUF805 family)
MMGGASIWHWIVVLFVFVPTIWAMVRILHRMGLSGWWVILSFIPLLNIVAMIALAIVPWPVERRGSASTN